MLNAKIKIIVPLLFVFLFFIPFFWNPVNINLHQDNAIQLLHVIRLADARFSWSADPAAIYANPLFQIFSNSHGAIRPIIMFPVFFTLDKLNIPINEPTTTAIYISLGFLIAVSVFLFLRKILDRQKAFLYFALLCSIPYVLMQIKFGWWNFYNFLSFFAGFYFLDDFFKNNKKNSYIFFCLSACACILSNPGFVFNGLFYVIYILIFLRAKSNSWKNSIPELIRLLKNPWTWAPVILIGLEFVAVYIAQKAGYGFGIILHLLSKQSSVNSLGLKTLAAYLLEVFSLTGFILFPAIIAAYIRSIIIFKKSDIYLKTSVIFFSISFVLFFIFGGQGAYIYETYVAALIILVYSLLAIKNIKIRHTLIAVIIASGLAQAIAYNFNYTPKNFLSNPEFYVSRDNNTPGACQAIWCPYHFEDIRNVGNKTLGFVARDYLQVSPKPYISKDKNFEEWPKEFFLYSKFYQSPSIHIGRRINYRMEYLPEAKIIAIYTPEILKRYPVLAPTSTTAEILKFTQDNPRYKLEAIVTIKGEPAIRVYELDGNKPEKTFPVEIYDQLFDEKYSNLKNLSHIDLGNI